MTQQHGLIPARSGKTPPNRPSPRPPPAHPRSRGENPRYLCCHCSCLGSSPLARGKRLTFGEWSEQWRLIPAPAGKTWGCRSASAGRWAHPRSCGENRSGWGPLRGREGSSPLTRGKRRVMTAPRVCSRLIPAHAGKTVAWSVYTMLSAAHPRSRGENRGSAFMRHTLQGSSPLTRGKPVPRVVIIGSDGLIPAHAGKTSPTGSHNRLGWAHPRSRGENQSHG